MKKNNTDIAAGIITGVCILFCVLIVCRMFAKEVLVDTLNIRNEFVSFAADYTWGDQLSDYPLEKKLSGNSQEYVKLRMIYNDAHMEETVDDSKEVVVDISFIHRYEEKINEMKSDINNYCNHHFLFRPYLTDLRMLYARIIHWNMAYARNEGDEYMLSNGVVDTAVAKNVGNEELDLTVKNAAEKYGVNYLFLQYPYRVNYSDSYIPYGVENWCNENADAFLNALRECGGKSFDLREKMFENGWDNHEGYYITDKHWKTDSGFLAADILSKYLADNYDAFKYYPNHHDLTQYKVLNVNLNNPMIRENVNLYLPDFDTDFKFICLENSSEDDIEVDGSFVETLFDMTKIEDGRFSNVLTAYSVSNVGKSLLTEVVNKMENEHSGTILYISNSFSWHIIPYLAMDCDKIIFLHIDAKDKVEEIIANTKPDVVIEAPF